MIDTNELKIAIMRKNKTQAMVAKEIGITPKSFYLKMKKGVFLSNEIEKMIKSLEISNPMDIFFADR